MIAGFIVDFYCHEAGLVIEVDGGIHQWEGELERDAKRDQILCKMGLRVIRFQNEEVGGNLPVVLKRIRDLILEGSVDR